jgi:hypothetical protein
MIAANLDLRDPCHGPRGQFDADEVDSELGLKSPHSENSVHVAAVDVTTHSDFARKEDAMGMHERRSGEYEYDIEVLPLVPPMSNGNSYEAKVVRVVRRQPSNRAESASPLSFGVRRGKTEAATVQIVEADVEAWIRQRRFSN